MWPNFFPENCPPEDAQTLDLDVFRLVDNNPPMNADFRSAYETNPSRKYHGGEIPIMAYGISCFTNYQHAVKQGELLIKLPIHRKRKTLPKMVARGKTDVGVGVVKKTPSKAFDSHITYWLRQGAQPELQFQVV